MSSKSVWYGFLEAGPKSSAVVIDPSLNTGDPETVYVFNLVRNKILEYKQAIIESKLRELTSAEEGQLKELKSAFKAAKGNFSPKGNRSANVAENAAAPAVAAATPAPDKDADFEEVMELDSDEEFDSEFEED